MKMRRSVTNHSSIRVSVLLPVFVVFSATERTERSGAIPRVAISGDAVATSAPATMTAGHFRNSSVAGPNGDLHTSNRQPDRARVNHGLLDNRTQ